MAELNFNADAPFPPAHIAPGSALDKFRTLQSDLPVEQVIPPQQADVLKLSGNMREIPIAPAPVTTFWPEDINVVTAANIVEPEVPRFPVEPTINPEYEIVKQALIESKPEIETPAKRGPGRPKGSGKPKQENSLQSKVLYSRYLAVCTYRKEQQVVLDKMVADAFAEYKASKQGDRNV